MLTMQSGAYGSDALRSPVIDSYGLRGRTDSACTRSSKQSRCLRSVADKQKASEGSEAACLQKSENNPGPGPIMHDTAAETLGNQDRNIARVLGRNRSEELTFRVHCDWAFPS